MRNINQLSAGLVLSALLLLAGCPSGGGLPEGETGTISGTVTHKDSPVPADSTVTFMQVGGTGLVGTGTTDAEGKYTITMRDGSAVLVGKYQVSVTPSSPTDGLSPDEIMNLEKPPESPKPKYDEKFMSPETSGLSFDVSAGENTIDIKLD